MTRAFSASLVMLKSSAIVSRDGAIIVDARGDMNVKQATRRVAVHRFRSGQFLGSAGSSSEDHVTKLGSTVSSGSGLMSGSSCSLTSVSLSHSCRSRSSSDLCSRTIPLYEPVNDQVRPKLLGKR